MRKLGEEVVRGGRIHSEPGIGHDLVRPKTVPPLRVSFLWERLLIYPFPILFFFSSCLSFRAHSVIPISMEETASVPLFFSIPVQTYYQLELPAPSNLIDLLLPQVEASPQP